MKNGRPIPEVKSITVNKTKSGNCPAKHEMVKRIMAIVKKIIDVALNANNNFDPLSLINSFTFRLANRVAYAP
jgi:hypothetical protein